MSTGWKTFVNLAAVGDVTGDGRPDLMGRVDGGKMTIFPGAGGAKFRAPILAPASMRTFNQIGSGSWRHGARCRARACSASARSSSRPCRAEGQDREPVQPRRRSRRRRRRRSAGPGRPRHAGTLWLLPGHGRRLRRPALPGLGLQRLHDLSAEARPSGSQLRVGPLVHGTSGPRRVRGVAQQHQGATADSGARNAGTPRSGRRVLVGEQAHAGLRSRPRQPPRAARPAW